MTKKPTRDNSAVKIAVIGALSTIIVAIATGVFSLLQHKMDIVPTSTTTATFTETQTPTSSPTPTLACSQITSFRITSHEEVRGDPKSQVGLPQVSRTTKVSWAPAYCPMTIQFLQNQVVVVKYESAKSGEFDSTSVPPGWTQIKIWVPGNDQQKESDATSVVSVLKTVNRPIIGCDA